MEGVLFMCSGKLRNVSAFIKRKRKTVNYGLIVKFPVLPIRIQ